MDVAIGAVSQIPFGEGRTFDVGGTCVAVFRMRTGEVHATQANCPHRGGPLADGLTDERSVTCPLHDRVYDLSTGAGIGNEYALKVFPVKVTGDGTMVLSLSEERVLEQTS